MSLAPEIPVTQKRPALELLLGRIQANARAVPAKEKIDAFDDRWSTPAKPPIALTPPPAASGAPAQEKIDAFDDRWSSPARPPLAVAAKPVVAKPAAAPIAAPAGDRVSRLNSLLARIQGNRR